MSMETFKELDRKIADHCKTNDQYKAAFISVADLKEIIGTAHNTERLSLSNYEILEQILNLVLRMDDKLSVVSADNAQLKTDVQTISNVLITAICEVK